MKEETMVKEVRRRYEQPLMTVVEVKQQMIVCTSVKDYTLEEPDVWAEEFVFDPNAGLFDF